MKPGRLILFIILLTGHGCSKEDVKPIKCYPTQIGNRVLVYNKNNQVIVDDVSAYYQYDSQGNIISSLGPSGSTVYTYDSRNNLIRSESHDGSYTTYVYNDSGQLLSYTHSYFNPSSQTTTTSQPTTFEYPNTTTKNPSRMTVPGCCGPRDEHLYEYDDKPNPESVIFPSIHSENNVIQDSWTQTVPPITYYNIPQHEVHGVTTYTYTYNAQGYPLSIATNSYDPIYIVYDCK